MARQSSDSARSTDTNRPYKDAEKALEQHGFYDVGKEWEIWNALKIDARKGKEMNGRGEIERYCWEIFEKIIDRYSEQHQKKVLGRGAKRREALSALLKEDKGNWPDSAKKIEPDTLLPQLVRYISMHLKEFQEKKMQDALNESTTPPEPPAGPEPGNPEPEVKLPAVQSYYVAPSYTYAYVPNADIQIIRGNKPFSPFVIRLSDLCVYETSRSLDMDWVDINSEHKFDELLSILKVKPDGEEEVWFCTRSLGEVLHHYKDNRPDLNNKPWIFESLIDTFNYRSTIERAMQARYPDGHEIWSGGDSVGRVERPSFTIIIRRKGAPGDVLDHKKQQPVIVTAKMKRKSYAGQTTLEYTPPGPEEEVVELDDKKAWVNPKYKKQKKKNANGNGNGSEGGGS
ncbi:hypothetical protein N7456_000617 [Penicillium angulare]|uniref:Uncharacterized protein n=1 Tax=Penicillium angulare TaxID=116970 RepID=A0A9W9KSE4_9EURO|nr:hypothetical protein N7456_000617 [Penicillium angulare]